MLPVHELTPDEAVLELEKVCDDILDAPSTALLARKRELEAWILMHQVQNHEPKPEPVEAVVPFPKGRTMSDEHRQKIKDAWAAKKAGKAPKASHPKPQVAPPPQMQVDEPAPLLKISSTYAGQISDIRRQVWMFMASLEGLSMDKRELLVPDLALLDAAAHAAHQLALGRLEVA